MSSSRPIAAIVVNSLADELRQAGRWLGRQQQDPPPEQVVGRLHSLREAAAVAGAAELELALAEIENRLAASSGDSQTTHRQLEELADLLQRVEATQVRHLDGWLDSAYRVPAELNQVRKQAGDCRQLLHHWQEQLTADRPASRARLLRGMIELEDRLAELAEALQRLHQRAVQQADHLALTLAEQSGLSAGPMLFRLAQRLRQQGQRLKRPVTLACGDPGWRLSAAQSEGLEQLLGWLLEHLLGLAVESPEQRRRRGLPTVANFNLVVHRRAALLELEITHDGAIDRAQQDPWQPTADLAASLRPLRARLLVEPQRLVLAVPQVWGLLQVVPVDSALGRLLLPLACLAEVASAAPPADLPLLQIDRRADRPAKLQQLVVDTGRGKALTDMELTGLPRWVIGSPPDGEAPGWLAGQATEDGRLWPIVHPLYWMETLEGEKCLYPAQ